MESALRHLRHSTTMEMLAFPHLKQLCISLLQKEEVIICLAQKSSQHSPKQNSSDALYLCNTTLDELSDNDSLPCDDFCKETKAAEKTLYNILSQVQDVVIFLTSTAEEIITELNTKKRV